MKARATLLIYGDYFLTKLSRVYNTYPSQEMVKALIKIISDFCNVTIENKFLFVTNSNVHTFEYNQWKMANVEVIIKPKPPQWNGCKKCTFYDNAELDVGMAIRFAKEVYRSKNKVSHIITVSNKFFEDTLMLAIERNIEYIMIGDKLDVPKEMQQSSGIKILPILKDIMNLLVPSPSTILSTYTNTPDSNHTQIYQTNGMSHFKRKK
jgi:hypothetical protein